jgi:hypothetical protein
MTISVNSKKKQVKKTFDELLNDLTGSNSEKVRYNAARILGEMGDSKAVEPLIDVLKHDKNGSVRLYAARALGELGDCKAILTAGQLATKVFTEHFGITEKPEMGQYAEFAFEGRTLRLYRMPSTSRAYPIKAEKKAEYYRKMFEEIL